MSGLKSAWEISLEKSNKLVPEAKNQKKLTQKQKDQIKEIRKEFKAKIADKDVTLQHKLKHLEDRVRPEELFEASEKLKEEFVKEKELLESEMDKEIEAVREQTK